LKWWGGVGCTTGSREEVSGEMKPVVRDDDHNNNNSYQEVDPFRQNMHGNITKEDIFGEENTEEAATETLNYGKKWTKCPKERDADQTTN
jgi:hypothetical protein